MVWRKLPALFSGIFQIGGGIDSATPINLAAVTGVELANHIFPIFELQFVYMEDMIVFNIDTDGVSIASGLRWGRSHALQYEIAHAKYS
jgi:hypothetical protein